MQNFHAVLFFYKLRTLYVCFCSRCHETKLSWFCRSLTANEDSVAILFCTKITGDNWSRLWDRKFYESANRNK